MINKLSLTFILTPLLLAMWLTNCALDAHAKWEHIPGSMVIGDVYLLESDGSRFYAIGDTGFYQSLDDGFTWRHREISRRIDDVSMTAIGSGDGAVYVGTVHHGVFRSDDGGNTWVHINEGLAIFDDPTRGPRHGIVQQLLVTSSGMVINVGYHQGTHISSNRGDTWRDVTYEWTAPQSPGYSDIRLGTGVWSMGEFDNYLWAQYSNYLACRSLDQGATWERIPYWVEPRSIAEFGRISAWLVFQDNLYVAGHGFGRWREEGLEWEDLSHGLPVQPALSSLIVHRNRIFAGSFRHGVFIFDHHSETWHPAGLSDMNIPGDGLVTHRGDLYAATDLGIYRAVFPRVQPYNKATATWGAIKLGNTK